MTMTDKTTAAPGGQHTPPIKTCPHCFHVHASARRVCTFCGWEFYPSRKKGGAV